MSRGELMMAGFGENVVGDTSSRSITLPEPWTPEPWRCPPWVEFIGIDPGQQGYIGALEREGNRVWATPIPTFPTGKGSSRAYDLPAVWEIVRAFPLHARVILEKQQPYPQQGGKSNFSIGQGYMLWRAMLTAAGVSFELVAPQTWKPKMGLRVDPAIKGKNARTKAAKAKAVAAIQAMCPGVDLRDARKPKARVPCPDKAESILLADYGRRHL